MSDHLTDEDVQRTTEAAYEHLRRYPDRALAQIAIAETAAAIAEAATGVVARRAAIDGRDLSEDIEAAAHLLADAQELLERTVLAARLAGRSWDAIGEAVTGESGKRQTMINRYGHVETEWQDALLEPVETVRDGYGRIRATRSRLPEALSWDIARQVQRLQNWLDQYRPGHELDIYEGQASTLVGDYLWRLNAATDRYGLSQIPPALAADIDTRKAAAVAAQQSDHDTGA